MCDICVLCVCVCVLFGVCVLCGVCLSDCVVCVVVWFVRVCVW